MSGTALGRLMFYLSHSDAAAIPPPSALTATQPVKPPEEKTGTGVACVPLEVHFTIVLFVL